MGQHQDEVTPNEVLCRFVGMAIEQQMLARRMGFAQLEATMGWMEGTASSVAAGAVEMSWCDLLDVLDHLRLDAREFLAQLVWVRTKLRDREARLATGEGR